MHIGAHDSGYAQTFIERTGGRFVQRARVAHGAFDQLLENRNRHVGQQQAADGLVHAAKLAQRTGQGNPCRTGREACKA